MRVSIGSFDPKKASVVETKLIESKAKLEAGIRAMPGTWVTMQALTAQTTRFQTSASGQR